MTQPINQTQSSYDPSIHYDTDAGMCVAPVASGAPPAAEAPAVVEPDQGSQAAVDRLVRSVDAQNPRNCPAEVLLASINCAQAALSIASTPVTGPVGVALAVARGASCGAGAAVAATCFE